MTLNNALNTIVSKIDGLRSVELSIIANCHENDGQTFDFDEYQIDDLANVRIRILHEHYTRTLQIKMSSKKLAADGPITLNVACCETNKQTPKLYQELIIEREWIEFTTIGKFSTKVSCSNVLLFAFTIFINVGEGKKLINSANFYDDTHFTDFKLASSDGRSVGVHKLILASHSDMFKAMLMEEWKETKEQGVDLKGASLETLENLKKYMYLGTLPNDGLQPLLLLAKCYMIEKLKTKCINKLAETVTPEGLRPLLEFASENMLPELTFAILQFTPRDVVQSASEYKKDAVLEPEEM